MVVANGFVPLPLEMQKDIASYKKRCLKDSCNGSVHSCIVLGLLITWFLTSIRDHDLINGPSFLICGPLLYMQI